MASEAEEYLGGVGGSTLSKRGIGLAGYEIHATNRRIFGIRALKYLPGVFGSLFTGDMYPVKRFTPAEASPDFTEELERKRDFMLEKDDVSELLIVRPDMIRNGYLMITPKSGKQIMLRVRGQNACVMLIELMNEFYPDTVRIK